MSLTKSYDYTYCVIDNSKKKAKFRDITGLDLEFLEYYLRGEETNIVLPAQKLSILEYLLIQGTPPSAWAARYVNSAFEIIFKEIFEQEFMTKEQWLRSLYLIQNKSFVGLADMEKQPMNKFVAMLNVHSQLLEAKPDEQ